MLLTVVDYGVGNLRSIAKSIEKANSDNNLNYSVRVSSDTNDVKKSDKIKQIYCFPGNAGTSSIAINIDINDFEELGRVDSEKAYTKTGKKDLKAEKKRIVKKLNA